MSNRSTQPALRSATIPQPCTAPAPASYIVELHDHDCDCVAYEPYAACEPDTLSATAIGKLMVAGIFCGLAIILTIDPAGASAALLAIWPA